MDEELDLAALLFTPGSDLATGGTTSEFEAIFGRRGNDRIYADAPGADVNQSRNIDFLFGDLFDNTVDEYTTILNIQGGNLLRILETGPPSVGEDTFVLGDGNQPYYSNTGSPDALRTTNLLGFNEFAVLYDFNPAQDTIQLNGNSADYLLVELNGLQVPGVQQPFFGEAIFSLQQGTPDAIAYVISTPEVDLNLNGEYFDYVGAKPKASPTQQKIGQLGTTGIDLSTGTATDPAGNVYLTGTTSGPLQGTNQGSVDAWVAKYDSNGNQVWGKQIGTSGPDNAYAITTDNVGNFYVSGDTGGNLFSSKQSQGSDAWVAKYDSNGNQLWGKQFAAGGLANTSFGLDVEAGNVYVSGLAIKENQNREIFDFVVEDDAWVTRFDSNGNQQWFTEISGSIGNFFFDENYDLAVDKNGNAYLTGWTQGLEKESDPSRALSKYDAWLAKVNPAGQQEWVQQFGSTNQGLDFAWGVDTDSKNNIYVTGWTTGQLGTEDAKSRSGTYDIWLAKFDPSGTQVWAKQFGAKGVEGDDGTYLSDLEIDAQDNIFLTGYTNNKITPGGTADSNYNAWVAKFDTEGTNKWIQQFGSKGTLDYPTGLSADDLGNLYVGGFSDGLLGSVTTESDAGGVDAWFAKLDVAKGNLQKFTGGDSKGVTSISNPTPISTDNVSTQLVTDDLLPGGDNRIITTQGLVSGVSSLSYGRIVDNLASAFDPGAANSFPTVFAQGVANNNAPFLSSSDLSLLR